MKDKMCRVITKDIAAKDNLESVELIGDFESDRVAWVANIHEIVFDPTDEEIARVRKNSALKPRK